MPASFSIVQTGFKYNTCYYSTGPDTGSAWTHGIQTQYLLMFNIRSKVSSTCRTNSNTTFVIVHLDSKLAHAFVCEFKYNLCYCSTIFLLLSSLSSFYNSNTTLITVQPEKTVTYEQQTLFKYNTCYYSTCMHTDRACYYFAFKYKICYCSTGTRIDSRSKIQRIQIQYLLLFNPLKNQIINRALEFKYNTCYCSTKAFLGSTLSANTYSNTTLVTVHHA